MSFVNERYPAPDPRLVEQLRKQEPANDQGGMRKAPSLRAVQGARDRAEQAVQGLSTAYNAPNDSDVEELDANDVMEVSQEELDQRERSLSKSDTFRLKYDDTGKVVGAERVEKNPNARDARDMFGRYAEVVAEVGTAERDIRVLQEELRRYANVSQDEDQRFMTRVKEINQQIQDLTLWRDGRSRLAASFAERAVANSRLGDARTKELQVRSEYQLALAQSNQLERAIEQQEQALTGLREAVEKTMVQAQKMQLNEARLQNMVNEGKGFFKGWLPEARARQKGLEAQLNDQRRVTQEASQAFQQAMLALAERTQSLNGLQDQKEAADRRILELQQQIQAVQATVKPAA